MGLAGAGAGAVDFRSMLAQVMAAGAAAGAGEVVVEVEVGAGVVESVVEEVVLFAVLSVVVVPQPVVPHSFAFVVASSVEVVLPQPEASSVGTES